MKGKSYQPFGGGPSKALIFRAAKQAAKRAESYSFKTKNGDEGDVAFRISMEMMSLAAQRSHLLDPTKSLDKWTDRSSLIAAPLLASDMFLHCDRGSSSLMLQGPNFYQDKLSVSRDDPVTSIPIPPEVGRFPYSDEAHEASKKLSAKLAKNLARRHYAAAVLQRSYRAMRSMQKFRADVQRAHTACRKLQWFWRKRLFRIRERRALIAKRNRAAIKMQCMARRYLARRKVASKKKRKIRRAAITITRFMLFVKKEVKRKHGRSVRRRIHATRIQARYRGLLGRRQLLRMIWAKRRIWAYYRAHWEFTKGKFARRILHYIRRCIIFLHAKRIQTLVRRFLGERRFHRTRLGLRAYERNRITLENEVIRSELERDVRDHCESWIIQPSGRYGNELQRDTALDFMIMLDVCAGAILNPSVDKKSEKRLERRMQIFPDVNLDSLLKEGGQRRAISLAVLSAFCNHPHGMIDWAALEICKRLNYLTPVRLGHNDGLFSGFSKRNENEAWDFIQKSPLIDIITASMLLEPTLSLRCRVTVQGHLPDSLLAQAVIVRRWTHHVDFLMKRAIWKARLANPPRGFCHQCLEAVVTPMAMRQHVPCGRYGWCSWIPRSYMQLQITFLMNRLGRLAAYPALLRDRLKDDQFARMKVNSRRELAKRRGGAFATLSERHAHSKATSISFCHVDPERRVDKKALRLAKAVVSSGKNTSPSVKTKASSPSKPIAFADTPEKIENASNSFVVPPPGVDFIPFVEEHFPIGYEQLATFLEDEWENRPGMMDATLQKETRDKEGKVLNFEFTSDKLKSKSKKEIR